jgi:transcriptional regulator with XRE-family HTH domain
MCENFSERTDELAHRLRCSLRDLAGKIGISQAMLFAYRSGKSEPTLKALRKLQAAERLAGVPSAEPPPSPGAPCAEVREDPPPTLFSYTESAIRALVREELAHGLTIAELQARLAPRNAWPPTGPDLHLTPAQLWQKYAP